MIQAFRPRVSENMTAGAASTVSTNAGKMGDGVVRIIALDQPIRVAKGATPTATATSMYLPAGVAEYFLVGDGSKVAVLRAGSTDANVNVTFMTR